MHTATEFRLSVDVVIPTVRAHAEGLRRAVALPVPRAFAGLRFLVVVDGPQPEEAWRGLRTLATQEQECAVVLLSTRPGHHGWPAGASAARNVGLAHSQAEWALFLDDDTTPEADLLLRYANGGGLAIVV